MENEVPTTGMSSVGIAVQLRCILGHEFMLFVERESDLTLSHLTDDKSDSAEGFVIFRERSFVECGYCKSLCHFTGATARLEVNYKPPTV
jgi:hypothetical protein